MNAGLNGTARVSELLRPNGTDAFQRLAAEMGTPWEIAREMTFTVFCAALAAARRARVA